MKKTLIALAVIAAATIAPDQPEISAGETITDVPEDIAEQLLASGQAKLAEDAPPAASNAKARAVKPVRARVLVDCALGSINDVIEVPSDAVKAHESAGLIDTEKAAVAYALSLRAQA